MKDVRAAELATGELDVEQFGEFLVKVEDPRFPILGCAGLKPDCSVQEVMSLDPV